MSFTNFSPLTTLQNLTNTLEEHGVAVLPNVFREVECEYVKNCTFEYLAKNHGVKEPQDFERLHPVGGGIYHSYGISLIKEVLDMKTDERVENIFKTIWNGEDVTMSLDGINIGPPAIHLKPGNKFEVPAGFHTDQSSLKREKCCVQAFLNLEHTEDGDGCLSVLKGSHNFHAQFFDHFKLVVHKDWFLINQNHYDWFISKGCEWVKILAPKGSMILWDSRTIHKATTPMFNRVHEDRWRFVIYVCYTPARLQSDEDTRKKKEAYVHNMCTSHWPYNVRLFPKRNDDTKINKLKDLTPRHKKCLGFYN